MQRISFGIPNDEYINRVSAMSTDPIGKNPKALKIAYVRHDLQEQYREVRNARERLESKSYAASKLDIVLDELDKKISACNAQIDDIIEENDL